jgi:hypothetical protein
MDLVLAEVFAQDALDLLQERNRDGAAHATAVEREQALGSRIKQMAVAFALERGGHKPVLTIAIVLLRMFWAAVRRWVCNRLGDTMARAARIRQPCGY